MEDILQLAGICLSRPLGDLTPLGKSYLRKCRKLSRQHYIILDVKRQQPMASQFADHFRIGDESCV